MGQISQFIAGGAGIECHRARIAIGASTGKNRIAEAALFPHLLKQSGRHAATKGRRENLRRIDFRIFVIWAFKGQGKMCLFKIFYVANFSALKLRWCHK